MTVLTHMAKKIYEPCAENFDGVFFQKVLCASKNKNCRTWTATKDERSAKEIRMRYSYFIYGKFMLPVCQMLVE